MGTEIVTPWKVYLKVPIGVDPKALADAGVAPNASVATTTIVTSDTPSLALFT